MTIRTASLGFVLVAALWSTAVAAEEATLHLAIGDPARRDRDVPVVLDAITDAHTGDLLTPAELAPRLAEVDILFVGESHTSMDFHLVQLRAIEELHRAGRRVMIGLEMLPYTRQEHLDAWVAGHYTEDGFLERAGWYESWGAHWGYYRDIFLFARGHGLPMFAVNTPREVVSAVRKKGFQGLTEEEEAHIPDSIDTDSAEYLELFKAFFDEDDPLHAQLDDEAWRSMLRAQCTWDATMGYNSVRAFREHAGGGGESIFVVMIGAGHVAYDLGIARQSRQWFDGVTASLIPVPVRDEDDEPVAAVRASYADFVWGVPQQTDPLWPTLGLSTGEIEDEVHRKVIYVAEDSVAAAARFELGDVLLTLDGADLDRKGRLGQLMAAKRWGDDALFTVRRGEQELAVRAFLRRTDGEGEGEDDEGEDDEGEDEGEGPGKTASEEDEDGHHGD